MPEAPPDSAELPEPVPEDAAEVARIRMWNRFYKIAVIWMIGWVGLILEKMLKLDSVVDGLREGFMKRAFVALLLLVVTLPLGWLGARIGSREKWRRWRLWFTFALPALYVLAVVAWALHGRYFPEGRFKRDTGVEFPREGRMERCVFDDGYGFFDEWGRTYDFTCPAAETDRMVEEMKLKRESWSYVWPTPPPPSSGWTSYDTWNGIGAHGGISVVFQADGSHTKVHILCYGGY
ncbi:hypothetical protein [Luteolibacter soli]|uniref:Uncharacterized protein n=1 Tax=Luteolibacter soli TaxID=3135280 RepID=A0ABU9AXY3_9BACT